MDKVAHLPAKDRSELFSEAAAKKSTTPAIIEKDFWVTWVLNRLFQEPELSKLLMFKGGTSLSKVYQLIERFSEDIDLVLDWRGLTDEDPLAMRSRNKQARLNQELNEQAQIYIAGELLDRLTVSLGGICDCEVAQGEPHVINVRYPGAFSDKYLRPELLLEIGPLASWVPHEERNISCYAAEEFPDLFESPECTVKVIKAERTFWEKATILHQEAHRPEDKPQPPRHSRHYYDLAKMAGAPVKKVALADRALLENVVQFKQRFYPQAWAHYESAKPGAMRLVPDGHVQKAVETDYAAMANMIFGDIPAFADIMEVLQALEDEING